MTLVSLLHSASAPRTATRLARDELVRRGLVDAPDRTMIAKEKVEATYTIRRNILQGTRPDLAEDLDDMLQRLAPYAGDGVAVHLIVSHQRRLGDGGVGGRDARRFRGGTDDRATEDHG